MRIGHRALFSLIVAAAGVAALASPAAYAQSPAQPTKVATANPARIFNEMQETKDLKARLDNERKTLEQEELARRQKLKDLQAARDLLKPDSQQYADANKQLLQAAIEFETWGKLTQADVQRNQKQQMRQLFDKITAATADVAKQRGFDIVIADQRPELPANLDQLNVDQLRAIINQRNVLYSAETVDITSAVITALDAQQKTAGAGGSGGGAAPPAPAPTPTNAPAPGAPQ